MDLLIWIVVFVVSLAVLIKASDSFIATSEKIGLAFGIPHYTIGATIVAIGTSLPELVSSIIAVVQDSSEIVIGNVVGSNITNILLIFSVTAIISKVVHLEKNRVPVDSELFIGSALLMTCLVWDRTFSRGDALICIVLGIFYLYRVARSHKQEESQNDEPTVQLRNLDAVFLLGSTFFIWLGGKYCVESVIQLSELLHIGKEMIAATAIALGTSLPELAVTISASKRGRPEIALGNVLGSNIFNSLGVMGIPALLGPLVIPESIFSFALPVMLIATLFFWILTHKRNKRVTRGQGFFLLSLYFLFLARMVWMA